jgi:SpoVK/Ycf46/Vps4 family AAA+-type ATPase
VTFVSEDAPEVSRGFVSRPVAAKALLSRIAGSAKTSPPVVVLYGPAGTGKTALVAAIARELAGGKTERRSVLWLNLARSSDPLDGLMRALGVIERHDGRPPSRKVLPDPAEELNS